MIEASITRKGPVAWNETRNLSALELAILQLWCRLPACAHQPIHSTPFLRRAAPPAQAGRKLLHHMAAVRCRPDQRWRDVGQARLHRLQSRCRQDACTTTALGLAIHAGVIEASITGKGNVAPNATSSLSVHELVVCPPCRTILPRISSRQAIGNLHVDSLDGLELAMPPGECEDYFQTLGKDAAWLSPDYSPTA